MKIFMDQIPETVDVMDYPKDTQFVLDDSWPQRDPETGRLLPRTPRPLIYPTDSEVQKTYPLRIRFIEKPILAGQFYDSITIDYQLRVVSFCRVDCWNHLASIYKTAISDEKWQELLGNASNSQLMDWLECNQRHEDYMGYRDGWHIECCVISNENGMGYLHSMTARYKNSPYEKLLNWTEQFAPKEFEEFYDGNICPR